MSYLARINETTRINHSNFLPFIIGEVIVGRVRRVNAASLARLSSLTISADSVRLSEALVRLPLAERSAAFNQELQNHQSALTGVMHQRWWGEHYRADTGWHTEPLLYIDRAAAKTFGINGYGVHLNGYVEKADGLYLWVARRSESKLTAPGKLDQIVAGGLPADMTPAEAMAKEAVEEADFDVDALASIRAASYISYTGERRYGSCSDTCFVYDAKLSVDFIPRNTDGEVAAFELLPIEQVMDLVHDTTDFKLNCALVVIDFLVRHGYITPERSDYAQICEGLRQKQDFTTTEV